MFLSWLHYPFYLLVVRISTFFSKNLWRFLLIMVLVMYSLQDSCCLSTISLSRHRYDIPDFCLFTVTRCACDVDQSANIWIWVSQLAFVLVAFFWLLYRAGETQPGWNSCFGFQFWLYHVVFALSFLRSIGLACLLFYLSRAGAF